MATPYHPTSTELGGTALLFDPTVGTVRKGAAGTYKLGSLGIGSQADPELASAINALYFNDSERWPLWSAPAGTALPLPEYLVDSPDAHIVVNILAQRGGYAAGVAPILSGIAVGIDSSGAEPEYDSAQNDLGLYNVSGGSAKQGIEQAGTHLIGHDFAGTVPYVSPKTISDPQLALAINFLLGE